MEYIMELSILKVSLIPSTYLQCEYMKYISYDTVSAGYDISISIIPQKIYLNKKNKNNPHSNMTSKKPAPLYRKTKIISTTILSRKGEASERVGRGLDKVSCSNTDEPLQEYQSLPPNQFQRQGGIGEETIGFSFLNSKPKMSTIY